MRYPDFLKENGTIGFIAPSFGCASGIYKDRFLSALEYFEQTSYKTMLGPNCFLEQGVGKSNTAKACADEINDFFINRNCDIIISCGGGETMCEDLEYIDFDGIGKNPKWFMGYSDNTVLSFTLPTICDIASVYGPNAPSFGMRPIHSSLCDAMDVLTGKNLKLHSYDSFEMEGLATQDNPLATFNTTKKTDVHLLGDTGRKSSCSFSGRLLGGCMDILSIICGTKYDKVKEFSERYKEDGIIWFLESCDFSMMDVRRCLWKLKEAGWFEGAKGFIIGRPYRFGEDYMGVTNETAVRDMLGEMGVPIIMDADVGHLPPQMPLVNGAFANVISEGGDLKINMEFK